MGTIVDANRLTLQRAVETIDRANRFEEPLRRRTEGVTWMVWGLVTMGLALGANHFNLWTYESGLQHRFSQVALLALWGLAWLGLGLALSAAVWRIAGIAAPGIGPTARRSALASAGALAVGIGVLAGLAVLAGLGQRPLPWSAQMLPIGAAWWVAGVANLRRMTPLGRRVTMAIGVTIALLAVASALLVGPGYGRGTGSEAWMAIAAVTGGVPFLGGLWQTLRG